MNTTPITKTKQYRVAVFCLVDAEAFDEWAAHCKDGGDSNFAARLSEVYDDDGNPLVGLDVVGVEVDDD